MLLITRRRVFDFELIAGDAERTPIHLDGLRQPGDPVFVALYATDWGWGVCAAGDPLLMAFITVKAVRVRRRHVVRLHVHNRWRPPSMGMMAPVTYPIAIRPMTASATSSTDPKRCAGASRSTASLNCCQS